MPDPDRRNEPPDGPDDRRRRMIIHQAMRARRLISARLLNPEATAFELQAALIEVVRSSRRDGPGQDP
jgi:hypothetical protein